MDNIDKKLEELANNSADGINPVELWMREVISERESGIHRGRYNEPGDGGEDIYGISQKAREHICEMKKDNPKEKDIQDVLFFCYLR